jgi:uncharacterized membrane protein
LGQIQSQAVGQVSADGQFRWDGTQWVPIPKGEREATPWTRPMQLAAAGLFALSAVYSVFSTVVFVNHDSMLKALQAQGTQFPSGTDVDTVVNISIGVAIGFAVFIAVLQLVAALGSFLGWRWMFYAALVLFGLGGLSALGNITTFVAPSKSPIPLGAVAVSEVLELAAVAMFVWMLIGVVRYGPWAMKKPGA